MNAIALVDDEDYERINAYRWHLKKDTNYWYAVTGIKKNGVRSVLYMHKFVMNHTGGLSLVDHKSRNTLDNQKSNLRLCDKSQNRRNSKKRVNTTSKFIGVSFEVAAGKWKVSINDYGKTIYLGRFNDEVTAAKEYDKAAIKVHGEFANLNFGV